MVGKEPWRSGAYSRGREEARGGGEAEKREEKSGRRSGGGLG